MRILIISLYVIISTTIISQNTANLLKHNEIQSTTWSSFQGTGITNGQVFAVVSDHSGNIYVGGDFTQIEGIPANRVAKWNGASWSGLGSGVNSTVKALCIIGTDLYVGGAFTSAGGNNTIKNIAKWDGSNWTSLGTGVNNTVEVIKEYKTGIIAGGHFSTAGGSTAHKLAEWNGTIWSSWDAITDKWDLFAGAVVYSIGVNGSEIWAGGVSFTNVSSTLSYNLKYFNGIKWNTVTTQRIGSTSGTVWAIETNGIDVFIAGDISNIAGMSVTRVAKYDGNNWFALGPGVDSTPYELVYFENSLFVGGSFVSAGSLKVSYLTRWNGASWSTLGGAQNSVKALCYDNNEGSLIVGGAFDAVNTENSSLTASRIAKYSISDNQPISANVHILLEGPYSSDQNMNMQLNSNSQIPLNQPYNSQPWQYQGNESVASIPTNAVDWVLLELRDKTVNTYTIASRAAFLLNSGNIVDLDGISPVSFNVFKDDYYVVVKHRNHVPVMSADPVSLSSE